MSHHHHHHQRAIARPPSPPTHARRRRPHHIGPWGKISIVVFALLMLLGEWGSGIWST